MKRARYFDARASQTSHALGSVAASLQRKVAASPATHVLDRCGCHTYLQRSAIGRSRKMTAQSFSRSQAILRLPVDPRI